MAINPMLGNLNFDAIKDSIKEHLKQQDTFLDYDFEGSALNTILDVLAYNTMYYAYYANMIASEMFLDTAQRDESLISLVKPLGFVVPGKTSARGQGKIRGGGAYDQVPKYTKFIGNNNSGIQYTFYTTREYSTDLDGEAIVSFAEGKSLTSRQPLTIDNTTQKGFISGLDTDISTITVEVWNPEPETGQPRWEEWTRASSTESNLTSDSRVYWLERSELGFFVVFGGNFGSASVTQVGRKVTEETPVRVSYLVSSGESGNNVGNWSIQATGQLGNAAVDVISISSGGTDTPDIEMIRFFAPKWFAGQDRAVTVDDCRALLAKHGFVGGNQDPYAQFNVWGGETMTPPRYGRVFVTLSETAESDPVAASTAIEILEKKTCVTILPEFINPQTYQFRISGEIPWEPLRTKLNREELESLILQELNKKYTRRFEQSITAGEISNVINSVESKALNASGSDIYIILSSNINVSSTGIISSINFKNKCKPNSLVSSAFQPHNQVGDIPSEVDAYLYIRDDEVIANDGSQRIRCRYYDNALMVDLGVFGKFYPNTGMVEFANRPLAEETFEILVEPDSNNQTLDVKENMISDYSFNITLVRE